MNLAIAIPQDDLLLARLVCAKWAGVMNGIISVGVASLELDAPTDFLAGKDKIIFGFIEVLRCIGVKPGHAEAIEHLQDQLDQLSERATLFHRQLIEVAQLRGESPEKVRDAVGRVAASYAAFFQALATFALLLGIDADYSSKAQHGQRRMDEFLQTLTSTLTPSAAGA